MEEDVTTLTDEQLNEAVGTGLAPEPESPIEEVAEVEEQPEEVIEEVEQQEIPEKVDEEEKPASRREQLRIQQLLTKYPDLKERVAPTQKNEFIENLDAEPEVIQQLTENSRAQYNAGVEATRAEIRTSQWRTMLNIDAPQVEAKHGWLNPKSPEFQPAIADAVNSEFKRLAGYNDETGIVSNYELRYADFIEARVELSTRLAKAMTAESTKNIVKQTASTGLRPDGSSAKRMNLNQAPENMSVEELYASIGQKAPKK